MGAMSDDQDTCICGDRLLVHGGNEGSKRIIRLISVSIYCGSVVCGLFLFIIVDYVIFITGGEKVWETPLLVMIIL